MDWLEQELREALNRKDPAPDFAERVRGSLHAPKHRPAHAVEAFRSGLVLRTFGHWPVAARSWLATAAAIVITAGAGGMGYRQHRGEVARQQVMQAFRIAGSSLNHIQTQVREVRR